MTNDETLADPVRSSQPQYDDRVLAWVDVLGWRDLVRESEKDVNAHALLAGFAEQIADGLSELTDPESFWYKFRTMPGTEPVDPVTWSQFSDTFVISAAATTNGFYEVVFAASRLCWRLLQRGRLTRGAVVRGTVRHTDRSLYGPAVLEAYDIEHSCAVHPRVIVTDAAAAFAEGNNGLPPGLWLRQDVDQLLFLNVLEMSVGLIGLRRVRQLSEVEEICVRESLKHRDDPRVHAKYEWQLRYIRSVKASMG